jgi:hypothetical protein
MRATIEKHRELQIAYIDGEEEGHFDGETDIRWMYEEPQGEFDPNMVVASSPLGPDFTS